MIAGEKKNSFVQYHGFSRTEYTGMTSTQAGHHVRVVVSKICPTDMTTQDWCVHIWDSVAVFVCYTKDTMHIYLYSIGKRLVHKGLRDNLFYFEKILKLFLRLE